MTTRRPDDVASQIRSILTLGSASGLSDGQLLGRFASGIPETSGLAFEALVERHGPMVLRVCRGVLRDPHDAQDAFQATFLVLVRRAGSIRNRDSLASSLHGVALRVASHARVGEARRRRLDRAVAGRGRAESSTVDEAVDDLGPRLHEEVGRLPERYRAAVVLCYLEGHTCEDAARVLNWPVGTVKSRLSRARERLRTRLTRPDPPSAIPFVMSVAPRPIVPLSPRLAKATAEFVARFGAKLSPLPSNPGAVVLAEGVLKVMTLAKWKYPGFALLAASSLGVASALATPRVIPAPTVEVASIEAREEPKDQAPTSDPIALTIPHYLSAQAGSGPALLYALNAKGDRILDEEVAKAVANREARRNGSTNPEAIATAGPWKEVDVELRWVAVTGVVDNQGVREALALARKVDLSEAFPHYLRVNVQRQTRWPEGGWTSWRDVDANKNYEVLDHLPEISKERTPAEVRPPALVDPLPILKKGAWSGIDPEPILRLSKPRPDRVSADNRRLYQSPLLAIRSLDFTVEPGTTYRYRVRVLLVNPDVAKDGKKELLGPWSESTKEVAVP